MFNISKLSLLITYNDLDCYGEGAKYFDTQFQKAVPDRFIPFRMKGRITEQLNPNQPNVAEIAEQNTEHYKGVVRSVMWYQSHWQDELATKQYRVKTGNDYGLPMRWAANFDTIAHFIKLYAHDEAEAQRLTGILYNRHIDYLAQFRAQNPFEQQHPRETETKSAFTEESIGE
jgi:hypothetical protein